MNNLSSALSIDEQIFVERIKQLAERKWWVDIPITTPSASWLLGGECRLDGRYYADQLFLAMQALASSKFETKTVGAVTSQIYYPERFKRIYAASEKGGRPFLTASHSLHFRPVSDRFLSNSSPNYDSCIVEKGVLLMTRSGTVGRITLSTDYLANFAISDDLIRIHADQVSAEYLYAYISTWVGNAFVTKDRYGSAIKHLEPHHVSAVPIPILPPKIQDAISAQIAEVFQLRDKANVMLTEAQVLFHQLSGLPVYNTSFEDEYKIASNQTAHIPDADYYTISSADFEGRLDGSYHIPAAQAARDYVRNNSSFGAVQLASLADNIFHPNRFPRTYVDKDYGVEFLQGSHLPQMSPLGLKYVSKKVNENNLSQCLLERGWVLVTRSGTIGRVGYVPTTMQGWAASEHIIRIVPNSEKAHAGYIAAFLETEYAQHQVKSKIYGAVVDELTEEDLGLVLVPNLPFELQAEIGTKYVEAYEMREQARKLEEKTIAHLESILTSPEAIEEVDHLEQPVDWAFTPSLGFEIEPTLTEDEFMNFLGRLGDPKAKPSDPENSET